MSISRIKFGDTTEIIKDSEAEEKKNKVTSLSGSSTDEQYPSAKAVYDSLQAVNPTFGDLSYMDIISGEYAFPRNTANAYVVKKAGSYRFPLVYGNGIKNGKTNAAAYTRLVSDYTADFVNHLGNTLTSPFIEENTGCTAASVGLLWQTATGMISSVSLENGSDCRYLHFTVASVPATNGLAVLYVKDSNSDIMWSWTVWVTADALSIVTLTNYTEVDYDMMSEPYGAIWDANRAHYVVPLYQWGRKDPMCPAAAYNSSSNMTLYNLDGTTYSGFGGYGADGDVDQGGTVRSVANSIKMPNKFFIEYDTAKYNWNNLAWFNNFWNAAETTSGSLADNQSTAIKTIYDPCPVGYMLPSGRFATGFTATGSNTEDSSKFNVIGSWANGWKFKKDSSDTTGLFVPAAGYRYRASGGLYGVGSLGYWWAFAPYSQTNARGLYFYSSYVNPLVYSSRAYAFALWPSRELN